LQVSEDKRGVQISWCLRFEKDEQHSVNPDRPIRRLMCILWWNMGAYTMMVTKMTTAITAVVFL